MRNGDERRADKPYGRRVWRYDDVRDSSSVSKKIDAATLIFCRMLKVTRNDDERL